MKKQHLAGLLAGVGALVPFAVQAQPSTTTTSSNAKSAIEPGEMIMPGQLPAGYNYPAAYRLSEGWDFFVTADYIYWMASQENMIFPGVVSDPVTVVASPPGVNGPYLEYRPMNTTFKSGFKVGLGWQMPSIDNWVIGFEYTWYHNTFTDSLSSAVLPNTATAIELPLNITTASHLTEVLFNDLILTYASGSPIKIQEQWNLAVDILDGKFERPYYLGTRLLITQEAGARAMWIEQTVRYANKSSTANSTTQIKYHSNNWGLGPRIAMRANWFLGMGISLVSKAGASLLFTQYNEIYRKENNLVSTGPTLRPSGEINVFRPQMEAGLGVQWGTYLGDDSMHLDLSAIYDFNMFWNQNEAFNFLYGTTVGAATYPGSLYLHGLTIRAGFDF